MYCDYEFPLHDELTIPPNEGEETYLESDCTEFCRSAAEGLSGEQNLCCDYESWSDGSFNCYLYGADPNGES